MGGEAHSETIIAYGAVLMPSFEPRDKNGKRKRSDDDDDDIEKKIGAIEDALKAAIGVVLEGEEDHGLIVTSVKGDSPHGVDCNYHDPFLVILEHEPSRVAREYQGQEGATYSDLDPMPQVTPAVNKHIRAVLKAVGASDEDASEPGWKLLCGLSYYE